MTYPGVGYSTEQIHLFLAESLEEVGAGSDDDEFLEPVRLPFAEAVRRARAGEVADAKTCVALLLAAAVLEGAVAVIATHIHQGLRPDPDRPVVDAGGSG